ncbi:MAG: RDD family protein [Carboxydocellales bacterium]
MENSYEDVCAQQQPNYVGFWKRFLAMSINIIFASPILFLLNKLKLFSIQMNSVLPLLIWYVVSFTMVIYLTIRYGGTPGKLLLKIRVVNLPRLRIRLEAGASRSISSRG